MNHKSILGALCLAACAFALPSIASPPDSPPQRSVLVVDTVNDLYSAAPEAYALRPVMVSFIKSIAIMPAPEIRVVVDERIFRSPGEYQWEFSAPVAITQMTTAPPA